MTRAHPQDEEFKHNLYNILNQAPDGVVVRDVYNRIRLLNNKMEELLGVSTEEVYGKKPTEVFSQLENTELEESIRQSLEEGTTNEIEFQLVNKRNEEILQANRVAPFYNDKGEIIGTVSFARDVTEEKRNSEFFKLITEHTNDIITLLDSNFNLLYINPAAVELLGYDINDFNDHWHPFDILHKDDKEKVREVDKNAIKNKENFRNLTFRVITKQGETKHLEANIRYIYDSFGQLNRILLNQRDVTDRKLSEQQVEDINRVTRHDLKNSINGIKSIAYLIKEQGINGVIKEYINMIEKSAETMLNSIDTSLNIGKIERGTYTPNRSAVYLDNLMTKLETEFNDIMSTYLVKLEKDIEEGLAVYAEHSIIKSVLTNLLKNAVEATKEKVIIKAYQEKERVHISMWNSNKIPDHILDKFGEKYVTNKSNGNGLGIYSIILFTEAQDGSVSWKTSEEHGTTITITLPKA